MHELTYVSQLYSRLIKEQKQITDVYLAVSSSSGIETASFIFYWNSIVKHTDLQKTVLHIRKIPLSLKCSQCYTLFKSREEDILLLPCPRCGSHKTVSIDQSSVTIKRITYETHKDTE